MIGSCDNYSAVIGSCDNYSAVIGLCDNYSAVIGLCDNYSAVIGLCDSYSAVIGQEMCGSQRSELPAKNFQRKTSSEMFEARQLIILVFDTHLEAPPRWPIIDNVDVDHLRVPLCRAWNGR